jgi:hypothetical protein
MRQVPGEAGRRKANGAAHRKQLKQRPHTQAGPGVMSDRSATVRSSERWTEDSGGVERGQPRRDYAPAELSNRVNELDVARSICHPKIAVRADIRAKNPRERSSG